MISFKEMVKQMQIDDTTMARHVDALLRDFVADLWSCSASGTKCRPSLR